MSMPYRSFHAEAQLFARHGVGSLTQHWRSAFLDIVDGRSVLLARLRTGKEIHLARIAGVTVPLVYDPHCARVITVLPWPYRLPRK